MPLKVLTVAQLQAQFGHFTFKEHPTTTGQIIPDPSWAAANIVSPQVPGLNGVATYGGTFKGKVQCHKLVAPFLVAAFQDIVQHGLQSRIIFWGGSYVPRHQTWDPDKPLSSHSWGVAIDLNPQWNGYNAIPAPLGKQGSVRELVPILERYGFAWGGDFGHQDGMHFEFAKVSLLSAAPPSKILFQVNGVDHPAVPLNRESDNRFYTVAGPLGKALGVTITDSEKDLRVPLRIIAELSGWKVKYTKDAAGERINLTKT